MSNRDAMFESEDEGEYELEGEAFADPTLRLSPRGMMKRLGREAAYAESEEEAEAFLGALVPLAAQAVPRAAPSLARAAPQLISGLARVGRTLRNNPATSGLVRALPAVALRTAADIARQASRGRPLTREGIARTLAGQTARVLGGPLRAVASPGLGRGGDFAGEFEAGRGGRRGGSAQSVLDDILRDVLRGAGVRNPVMYDRRGRPRRPAMSPLDDRRYGPPRSVRIDAGPPKVYARRPPQVQPGRPVTFNPLGHGDILPWEIRSVVLRNIGRGMEWYPEPKPGYLVSRLKDGTGRWVVSVDPRRHPFAGARATASYE